MGPTFSYVDEPKIILGNKDFVVGVGGESLGLGSVALNSMWQLLPCSCTLFWRAILMFPRARVRGCESDPSPLWALTFRKSLLRAQIYLASLIYKFVGFYFF